jgi:NAD(P)-dependent dehydrogenase (short-subunit alcohol dehydrogenase family)
MASGNSTDATGEARVALVTGASRGIGEAIAVHLAASGWRVVVCARSEDDLREVADRIVAGGGEAEVAVLDVLDAGAAERAVGRAIDRWGRLDLVVNNAGSLSAMGPLWETDPADWARDLTINVLGVYHVCRAVVAAMAGHGGGRVVNLVGGGTHRPFLFASAYATSKTAVMRLTENLQAELAETNTPVQAFAMTPGLIRTAMTEQFLQTEPGRRWMTHTGRYLEEGKDVTPEAACRLVAAIGEGGLDAFAGRFLTAPSDAADLDVLHRKADEMSDDDSHRLLRVLGLEP